VREREGPVAAGVALDAGPGRGVGPRRSVRLVAKDGARHSAADRTAVRDHPTREREDGPAS
jgi:hypothetical protein